MTEPSSARPVPGPPRPGGPSPSTEQPSDAESREPVAGEERFADLEQRPVEEHVDVFEEEHSRLRRELGTIDQL